MSRRMTPFAALLVFSLLAAVVSANEVTYDWSLVHGSDNGSEWELWYDLVPNRKYVTFEDLVAKGTVIFDSATVFGWTDDEVAGLYFETSDASKSLGIRSVNRTIPYNGERFFKAIIKLEDLQGPSGGFRVEVYYYAQNGSYLGKNDILAIGGTADWQEYTAELTPPAGTSTFAVGILLANSTGRVAFARMWMEK